MFFILLLIVVAILQFVSPSIYFVYTGALLLCIIAVDFIYSFISSRFITANIEHEDIDYHVKDSAYIKIRLKSKLPLFKTHIKLKVEKLQGNDSYTEGIDIGEREYTYKNQFNSIGTYRFTIIRVKAYGLCGIFSFSKKVNESTQVNVYPLPCDRKNVEMEKFNDPCEPRICPGDDYSEIYDLKVYKPGDDFKHVHHRLSAKSDDYIVKVGSDNNDSIISYRVGDETMSSYETLLGFIYDQYLKISRTGSYFCVVYNNETFSIRTKYNFYNLCDRIYKEQERK